MLPYLIELSKYGFEVTILSFEKKNRISGNKETIDRIIGAHGLNWSYLIFTKSPPIVGKVYDLLRFKRKAKSLCKIHRYSFVHCRSYVATEVGLYLKLKIGMKYLFDMRGFWVDERRDAKIWDTSKLLYRLIYNSYKIKERNMLENADAIVSLTHAGKRYLHQNFRIKSDIVVIPCAADLNLFKKQPLETRLKYREKLGVEKEEFLLVYLGSIGTWYMLEEMLDFFSVVLEKNQEAKFLFLTQDDPGEIVTKAKIRSIPENCIIITESRRSDVPNYLSASDASIFFIRNYFSKKASSPTKHGELLACHLPIICNNNIGDMGLITSEASTGAVVNSFSVEEYRNKFEELMRIEPNAGDFDHIATKYYSLDEGVRKYLSVYKGLVE